MTRRMLAAIGVLFALGLVLGGTSDRVRLKADATSLPSRIGDREFWKLAVESSEADGYFRSDNLTSNELLYQRVIPALVRRVRPSGVYLGVGPEQNFTYMAALRPPMAIIFDIRRGNMLVQLMYKALFELSRTRADFVSMLFSRPRPQGLGPETTVADLFSAFGAVQANEALFRRNLDAITERLTTTHGFTLSPGDLEGIEYAYRVFFSRGYSVRFAPTYEDLMIQTDDEGVSRSYLATEASFAFLKDLETRNMVVPVIGDFAGPKAIRAIAAYLKAHDARVSAFYLSNVEQYLNQDGKWTSFCRNVATLPLDPTSTFIRTSSGRGVGFGVGFVTRLGLMASEVRECQS